MNKLIALILCLTAVFSQELISPLQSDPTLNIEKALLGKKLFFDPKLSKDNTISCASCHNLDKGGDDNAKFSLGIENKLGEINSPTLFNARHNFVQFWDGRAKNLNEQVIGPIENPVEMGSNFQEIILKLKKDEAYVAAFKKSYNGEITQESITHAIVEFEKSLITLDSKFDRYLKGEEALLSRTEKEGFALFKSYGCISCHNGVNVGGNLFQRVGIVKHLSYDNKYLGRYNVTQKEEDKYFYKVPTLRNIELTAPYLHNGEIKTLNEAVEFMMEYQIGVKPNNADVHKITSFLRTLTGKKPAILEIE